MRKFKAEEVLDTHEAERRIETRFLHRAGSSVGSFSGVLRQVLRNSLEYSGCRRVILTVGGRPPTVRIADDGCGLDATARERCQRLGDSPRGSGHGGRASCLDVANTLILYTSLRGDNGDIWVAEFRRDEFYDSLRAREKRVGTWYRVRRATLPGVFPEGFETGTVCELRDFIIPETVPDTEWFRESIADHFPRVFAEKVTVNGRKVQGRKPEGYSLFDEQTFTAPAYGEVTVGLWLPNRTASLGFWIGAMDSTCDWREFYKELKDNNPALARRVPEEFHDPRIAGHLFIDRLYDFRTQGDRQWDWRLFRSPLMERIVEELLRVKIGPAVAERLAAYTREASVRTGIEAIHRVVSRLNASDGGSLEVADGGDGDESEANGVERIHISPAHPLVDYDGQEVKLSVEKPLDGETFRWSDDTAGLLRSTTGVMVVFRSQDVGNFPVRVVSDQDPRRTAVVTVRVRAQDDDKATPDRGFRLKPAWILHYLGDDHNRTRKIVVRLPGDTSRHYYWRMENPERSIASINEKSALEIELTITATGPGQDYLFCIDKENPERVARCRVEVLAAKVPERENDPDARTGLGNGGLGGKGKHLTPARNRFVIDGQRYEVLPLNIELPFQFEPTNGSIIVSLTHQRFVELHNVPEAEDAYVLSCIAACHAENLLRQGLLIGIEDGQALADTFARVYELGLTAPTLKR